MSIKIDGMVRVAAATPHVKVADCPYNKNEMAKMIREAAANGASVIAFPELAMTGYTCGDLFKDRKLMESAKACLFDLIEETEDLDILCAVGMPIPSGGALYNCAAVFSRGVLLGLPAKQHIPNFTSCAIFPPRRKAACCAMQATGTAAVTWCLSLRRT